MEYTVRFVGIRLHDTGHKITTGILFPPAVNTHNPGMAIKNITNGDSKKRISEVIVFQINY